LDRLTTRSRFQKWKAMTKLEMKGFFSAVINMGIIKHPDIESYWKTSWIREVPFFRVLMPRDRFQEIFWMLHVSHSNPSLPAKKINKIKQLLQLLIPKYREHYYPSENLAIDEKKPWSGFVVVLVPSGMHPKNQLSGALRRSMWLIPRMGIFLTP